MLTTIIVNYKSEFKTVSFVIEELSKCKTSNIIVIVNNQATDVSNSYLAKALNAKIIHSSDLDKFDDERKNYNCFVISSEENLGFAKANNLGVRFVSKYFNVNYILFSNNDIRILNNDVIEKLVEKYSEDTGIGMIGPKIIGVHGELQSPYIFTSFWEEILLRRLKRMLGLKPNKKYTLVREEAQEGFYYRLMGSFFLMDLNIFFDCGMMDENTFLYGEELLLAEQLKRINRGCYYLPSVSILHEHNQTIGKHLDLKQSGKYMTDSLFYYHNKYYNTTKLELKVALVANKFLNILSKLWKQIK